MSARAESEPIKSNQSEFWRSRVFQSAGIFFFAFFFLAWDFLLFPVGAIENRSLISIVLAVPAIGLQAYGIYCHGGLWGRDVQDLGVEKAKALHKSWIRMGLQNIRSFVIVAIAVTLGIYVIRFSPPDINWLALLVAVLLGVSGGAFAWSLSHWVSTRTSA